MFLHVSSTLGLRIVGVLKQSAATYEPHSIMESTQ